MSNWNLPPGVTTQMIEDAQDSSGMCIWDDCDQEAIYCEGHAREYMEPELVRLRERFFSRGPSCYEKLRMALLESANALGRAHECIQKGFTDEALLNTGVGEARARKALEE